jgi:adenosylcobinamide amidohydrolase
VKRAGATDRAARASSAPPWNWQIAERTLIIRLNEIHRVLSWASLGGGWRYASTIINHQIAEDDRAATEQPRRYLNGITRLLRLNSRSVAAMMTAADVRKPGYAVARQGDLMVGAWCTAGCSNALRIGDPATAFATPGTINLAVAINQRLSGSAMAEALAMATEARVAAVYESGILSMRTKQPATGTGTDCIVVASSRRGQTHHYCGKHTLLGELIGKAALRSCGKALHQWSRAHR